MCTEKKHIKKVKILKNGAEKPEKKSFIGKDGEKNVIFI